MFSILLFSDKRMLIKIANTQVVVVSLFLMFPLIISGLNNSDIALAASQKNIVIQLLISK